MKIITPQTETTLYDPQGHLLFKATESDNDRSRRLTFGPRYLTIADLKGAEPKKSDYTLYLEMYKRHPTVSAAINKIVKVCTNTGWDFVPRDSRTSVDESEYNTANTFFNTQPDFMTEARKVYQDLLIFGDAFLYVVPNRRRKPSRLKRLAPWTVHIKAKKNGKIEFYCQKDPNSPRDEAVFFQPHEILHFKLNNPEDDLYGLSPLEALKSTVTTDFHAMEFNKQFFMNGASTGTMLFVEEATEDELERNKKWLQEEYTGTRNAHKPIILAGKVKLERSVQSHNEMSFIEMRNFIIEEILSVLDVPPAKIGRMETANRSNAKEQDKSFRTEAIAPLQYTVENVLNNAFMRDILGLHSTLFQHSEVDVRDALEFADLNGRYLDRGVLTVNEVRGTLGKAPIDGGDVPTLMSPTGAIPIDRLDLYFTIAQSNIDNIAPKPRSPKSGETIHPPPDTRDTGQRPAKSIDAQGAVLWLQRGTDTKTLRQAYSFAMDAAANVEDEDSWLANVGLTTIKKAIQTDDEDLRCAYAERALAYFTELVGAE